MSQASSSKKAKLNVVNPLTLSSDKNAIMAKVRALRGAESKQKIVPTLTELGLGDETTEVVEMEDEELCETAARIGLTAFIY